MDNLKDDKNIIKPFEDESWVSWSKYQQLSPEFEKISEDSETLLKIKSDNKIECYGKWICINKDIVGGKTYNFSVEFKSEEAEREQTNVCAILTWIRKGGSMIKRDYMDFSHVSEDGWKVLDRKTEAPLKSSGLKVELVLRWTKNGSVIWRRPSLVESEPLKHRIIRVATTLIKPNYNLEKNLVDLLKTIDEAGSNNPDIICLSETYYDRGVLLPLEQRAEPIPGHIFNLVAEKAKKYNTYIILDMNEVEDGKFYNTSVLIDRNGHITGKYRKTHLPMIEADDGITPGFDYPVFETDFGKIGILICWDHWFPETARILCLKGAEVLFVPTIGYAPIQAQARAVENGLYVVVAGSGGKKPSRIINPQGKIVKALKKKEWGVCVADIDIDEKFYEFWLSVGRGYGEPRNIYPRERRPDTYISLLED
jgi:predicted amidohydrolase